MGYIRPTVLEIFEDPVWQMSRGERAAVEGVLASLRPDMAIEIGSMEGACLRRIAASGSGDVPELNVILVGRAMRPRRSRRLDGPAAPGLFVAVPTNSDTRR